MVTDHGKHLVQQYGYRTMNVAHGCTARTPYRRGREAATQARSRTPSGQGTCPTVLYLFDCDGVLIESEIIASEVDADLLTAAGYEISAEDVTARFAGMTVAMIVETVEQEMGRKLPADFVRQQREELDKRLAEEVDPMEGVHDMLDELVGDRCVCSNSSGNRLEVTLKKTQLYERFAPHIYSAPEVGTRETKPDPNVYTYAAAQFGVDPADAVVLEDTATGVAAARAAGMRVIGFTGGSHTWPAHADVLTEAGAETVIRRITDYPATAAALHGWRQEAV